jgi:aryl-alcohol dehydrogenase-like predicted oxidoreductase
MPLEYRKLGRTELPVSSIGLGCVTFGREIDGDTSFQVLDRAISRGVNLLDTAAVYGDGASETILGKWLRHRRARAGIVVATKVTGRLTRESIFRSVEGSLARLGVEPIDLLQAHDWDELTPLEETLDAFDELIRQGKIRHYGCSNWRPEHLQQALSLAERHGQRRLESLQPIYNLVDRTIEQHLVPWCAQQDLGVIAYSPLGAGFLAGKYRPGEAVPAGTRFDVIPGHQKIYFTDHGFKVLEGLRQAAAQARRSLVHVALSWVLSRPGVTSVLIGARRPEHVDQAFEALDSGLPNWTFEQLDRLSEPPAAPRQGC